MERFSIPSKFSLTNDNIIKNNSSFHPVKLRMMSSGSGLLLKIGKLDHLLMMSCNPLILLDMGWINN